MSYLSQMFEMNQCIEAALRAAYPEANVSESDHSFITVVTWPQISMEFVVELTGSRLGTAIVRTSHATKLGKTVKVCASGTPRRLDPSRVVAAVSKLRDTVAPYYTHRHEIMQAAMSALAAYGPKDRAATDATSLSFTLTHSGCQLVLSVALVSDCEGGVCVELQIRSVPEQRYDYEMKAYCTYALGESFDVEQFLSALQEVVDKEVKRRVTRQASQAAEQASKALVDQLRAAYPNSPAALEAVQADGKVRVYLTCTETQARAIMDLLEAQKA